MKEFVISEVKVETAILVGLVTQTQEERKTTEYLDKPLSCSNLSFVHAQC